MVLGDTVPYQSDPISGAHPSHLAAVAGLLSIDAPRVDSCRVLELGCGNGGNLISIAHSLPRATCVGIDISQAEIARGCGIIEQLGLRNIQLQVQGIESFPENGGTFDYIICHGLFSWVPAAIRDAVLKLCERHLAPEGMAYVSYNTFPGWHSRQIVRDIALHAAGAETDPGGRARRAKNALLFTLASLKTRDGVYDSSLKHELKIASDMPEWYLLHDYIAEENNPFSVTEFVNQAQAYGLEFLGDTEVSSMFPGELAPAIKQSLQAQAAASLLDYEQQLDFIRYRMFRRTLLVRKGRVSGRKVTLERLGSFLVASGLRMSSVLSWDSAVQVKFMQPDGGAIVTHDPFLKAVGLVLEESWPRPVSTVELQSRAHDLLINNGQPVLPHLDMPFLLRHLGTLFMGDLLRFFPVSPGVTEEWSEHPRASSLARLLAAKSQKVPTLLHDSVMLSEPARRLLVLMDGSRSRAELEQEVRTFPAAPGGGDPFEEIRRYGLLAI